MKVKNKWNVSFIVIAVLTVIFTTLKVAIHSPFWIDKIVTAWFSHVPDSAIPFFKTITRMGNKKEIGGIALLMLAWLLLKKRNYLGAALVALATGIGNEISKWIKDLFERPRPDLEHLVIVKSYSFPSGHAMVGMIIYFLIAYLIIEEMKSITGKIIVGLLAGILLLLIGASRIILHVHYPSDVFGGYAFGFIWVSLWIWLYQFIKSKWLVK
ncbi:phosphatase PAP2 family protein [Bacillus sp. JJ1764]|uniref:phosphatase PAP2 family protein n=1 Tax=Bacillus sp. JJ1764 TaxID=3122964 RepID=UPI002FFE80DD